MSPQRARMIDDMILAGLAEGTRKVYVRAVRRLAAHYHRSPDLLSEAAYGTDIALAEALGDQELVGLLTTVLEEEKQTDLKPTRGR